MRRLWGLSFILLLVLISACQRQAPAPPTALSSPAATIPGLPVQMQAVSLVNLLRNPGNFLNSFVQVSGQYKPRPLLVCPEVTNRSPATWALTAGDLEIGAGGLDGLLRDLAPEGLELVVEGRWRRWTGPVGCGRRPPEETVWYLEVARIVSPNPLTAAGSEGEVAMLPTLEATATVTVVETATPEPTTLPTPTETAATVATPESSLTPTPTAETPEATVTATPSAAPSEAATASPTPTSTASPSATSPPEASPSATPLATGVLSFDLNSNLIKRTLQAGQTHQWQFAVASNTVDVITTISVASSPELDVAVTLIGPDQQELVQANNAAAGGIETIAQFTLTQAGTYYIRVRAEGSGSGSYALALLNSDSEPFYVHQGNLSYNGSGSGSLPESVDHLYHFVGQAGERITVSSTSGSNTDLVLYLLGPQGTELIFVDDAALGMPETISAFELPSDGYYSIGVGDADFQEASYTVTLTRDS